jgi:hypothetical protein
MGGLSRMRDEIRSIFPRDARRADLAWPMNQVPISGPRTRRSVARAARDGDNLPLLRHSMNGDSWIGRELVVSGARALPARPLSRA